MYDLTIPAILAAVVAILFSAYVIGLVASRGWHRGKREFVDKMVKDSCKEAE